MYEQVTRVPMIVWAPGRFEGGRSVEELVSLMDIGPAVLEMAGIEPDPAMEARSVLPVLKGREWAGRDYVFAEQARDGNFGYGEFMTMVRGERWKLVHFLGSEEGQLFDLESDPGEQANLWDAPEHAAVKEQLLRVMLEWRVRSGVETASHFEKSR